MDAGAKDATRSAEEEALKRNTDCVYFLASPLTCKKGVECEYRHSEGARVNPRDCWFWLNGNCLNLKCSFRHPPLDGLIGTPTAHGSTLPTQPKISTHASSAHTSTIPNSNKQSVPCYYFQRGGCLKGDRCHFSHGSAPVPNPVSQQAPKVNEPVTEPTRSIKKASCTLDKGSQQNNMPDNCDGHIQVAPASVKSRARVCTSVDNEIPIKEIIWPNVNFVSQSETIGVPHDGFSAPSRSHSSQSEPLEDESLDEKEGDEYLRESSPGFDVLVDDDTEDPGYFDEDNFGGASGHDARDLNLAANFDYHHSSDYETAAKIRSETFGDASERGYHRHAEDYYARNHDRDFYDRSREIQSVSDRRRSRREDNISVVDGSDLRHQLLKKRRINTSRSSVSPDGHDVRWHGERYFEEQRCRTHGCRDERRNAPREMPSGKRLQGRISLPRRIHVDNGGWLSDREIDRGRIWDRSSGRSANFQQRRIHDKINRRPNESFHSDGKKFRTPSMGSNLMSSLEFTGPKSLSELKSRKLSHATEQSSVDSHLDDLPKEQKNMKSVKVSGHQETESILFDGPQPLSVILKRKRETATAKNTPSSNVRRNGETEGNTVAPETSAAAISSEVCRPSESMGTDDQVMDSEAGAVDIEDEDTATVDMYQSARKGYANGTNDEHQEFIEEDGELEYYEQRDGDYYQEDGGYGPEGGEKMYKVGEEEEDGDNFAKKLTMYN